MSIYVSCFCRCFVQASKRKVLAGGVLGQCLPSVEGSGVIGCWVEACVDKEEYAVATGKRKSSPKQQDSSAAPAVPLSSTSQDSTDLPVSAPTYVVGLGASAGGLEALEQFFEHVPAHTGMAFVVVQHLSPDFKSYLDQLLARCTSVKIRLVEDAMGLEADHIYLIPPRCDLRVEQGRFCLSPPTSSARGVHLPIDTFFSSLAVSVGDKAIGIILSGTGSDGSKGIQDIHEMGGMVLVQMPDTAKFDGMPRSALHTGVVDAVLAPVDMAAALLRYVQHRPLLEGMAPDLVTAVADEPFETILSLVRQEHGIDFTHYRRPTLRRRLQRRMGIAGMRDMDEYLTLLRTSAEERQALRRDFLIGVTHFFRDPEAFQLLEQEGLMSLVSQFASHHPFRVWIPACSTGEEAYSLAILLREAFEKLHPQPEVKIFATDVDPEALEVASRGLYPESIAATVSPERLARFFLPRERGYQVTRSLREMILFAVHDLLKDPPFQYLHLISCRNALIYLDQSVQRKILEQFHHALYTGGMLFLGPSESLLSLEDAFATIHSKWKLFRKFNVRRLLDQKLPLPVLPVHASPGVAMLKRSRQGRQETEGPWRVYNNLVERYSPPALVVSGQRQLLWVIGEASVYLKKITGPVSTDILQMVVEDLTVPLSAAFYRVSKAQHEVVYDDLQVRTTHGAQRITLRLQWLPVEPHEPPLVVISLEPLPSPAALTPSDAATATVEHHTSQRIRDLEQDLQYAQENLQATIQELTSSNEELQSTNEELLAANEELQSANEELHAANEELSTVNGEYQSKLQELTALHEDMDNLLRGADIGTVFLDQDLRIRTFTPAMTAFIPLVEHDIGRPIGHFAHSFAQIDLAQEMFGVVQTGQRFERELQTPTGIWLLVRILPFLTTSGIRQGTVLTCVDITRVKQAEELLRQSRQFLQVTLDALPAHVVVIDEAGTILAVNAAWRQFADENAFADPSYGLGMNYGRVCSVALANGVEEAGLVAQGIHELLTRQRRSFYLEYPCHGPTEQRWFMMQAVRCIDDEAVRIVIAHTDITARKRNEDKVVQHSQALTEQNAVLNEFAHVASHDLQEPIRQVVAFSQLLRKELGSTLSDRVTEFLQYITEGTTRMQTLVKDLLAFAQAGRSEAQQRQVPLTRCVQEVLHALAHRIDEYGAAVIHTALPTVIGDPMLLTQLYQNLLGNALKYRGSDPPVIRLSAEQRGQMWILGVQDNGIGFDPTRAEEIFLPFKRLHGRGEYEGTGIGLAICKRIVERHGGRIWGESQPGHGATFYFTLPVKDLELVSDVPTAPDPI